MLLDDRVMAVNSSAVRTEEDGTKRNVAIKKVSHTFENITDATRLLREIRILKHFHHENVCLLFVATHTQTSQKRASKKTPTGAGAGGHHPAQVVRRV